MAKKHKYRRVKPAKRPDDWYVQLWYMVDGAIRDTFRMHPEYLAGTPEWIVRNSINKRVVGVIKSYAGDRVGSPVIPADG